MSPGIETLRNLGPKSAGWLRHCGVQTIDDLQRMGAVAAFQLVCRGQCGATVNLLWALAAGLENRDWRELTEAEKAALREALGAPQSG